MSKSKIAPGRCSRPIAIDFFCGAGGMSLGIEQAGFDVALGVDVDGYHVATHERNFPYGKSLCASVVDITGDDVRKLIGVEEIDLVVGGPPCQGFSHMGLRDLKDPRNSLIDHYIRLVVELRPKAFVMENVPGMLSGETRGILDGAIKLVRGKGYNVVLPVRVLDASDLGVPQQRRRLFLLGLREDIRGELAYPRAPEVGWSRRPTVSEAIDDLPYVEDDERLYKFDGARYASRPTNDYARIARGARDDLLDKSHPRDWDRSTCTGCLRTRHALRSIALYEATPPGQMVPGHKLPRLDPDGVCPTLRAGSDSTHGSHTAPRPIHPSLPRCITSREAARLHGFPDWFAFYPSKWHAYRQIGNAVCPPVARAIGRAVLTALGAPAMEKPIAIISLSDDFILPSNRPRAKKRIPLMEQYPPVIEFLFAQAFDTKRRAIRKPCFSFADVQRAIKATGVDLHWVREDTFLQEIARSRRVRDLIRPAMEHGYSIVPCPDGSDIGRFVPAGTPGTIEDKDTVQIRVDRLHDAIGLPLPNLNLNGDGWGAVAVLSEPKVQEKLWGSKDWVVGLTPRKTSPQVESLYLLNRRKAPRFVARSVPVITCAPGVVPTKSRIARIAKLEKADSVTVLVSATSSHVIAIQFDNCQANPKEVARFAFTIGN